MLSMRPRSLDAVRSASNLHDEAGVDRADRQLPDDWIGEILEGCVH
jgi:hypothetical protein